MSSMINRQKHADDKLRLTLLCIENCSPCELVKRVIGDFEGMMGLEIVASTLDITEVRKLRKEVGRHLEFPILLLESNDNLISRRWGATSSDPAIERDEIREWLVTALDRDT